MSTTSVTLYGNEFRASDQGRGNELAFAQLTCLLYAASPPAIGLAMAWTLEAAEDVTLPSSWPAQGSDQGTDQFCGLHVSV
jgi:hypothetical protein